MRKFSYDEIKKYIDDTGCELLDNEYLGIDFPLKIKCSCGNIFSRQFYSFKNSNYLCIPCWNKKRAIEQRFTFDFVHSYIKKEGYVLLSKEYKNNKDRLIFKDENNYKYYYSFDIFSKCIKRGMKFPIVNQSNPFSTNNMMVWFEKNPKNYILIDGKYYNATKKNFILQCDICGEKWNTSWHYILVGQGCPYCSGHTISSNNNLGILFPEMLSDWDYLKNGSPYIYFPNSNKKVSWICNICGKKWIATIFSRIKNGTGCPFCNMSGGAKKIKSFLERNNFLFIIEYGFDDLKGDFGRILNFDFGIFLDNNILCLIEFDGSQHYEKTSFFHSSKEEFEIRIKYDKMRNEYAKKNHIPLLRIRQTNFKNIDKILSDWFTNCK